MSKVENVGEYLRELRGDKSLGQVEVVTGITKSYLSKVERGERGTPSPKILQKLAKAYNVNYDDLLDMVGYTDLEPEVLMIRRAAKKMDSVQKEKMMNILRAAFDDLFTEDDEK